MKILAIDNWSSGALELLALLQKFDEELSKKMEWSFVRLVGRRAARLQHVLHEVEADARLGLVLAERQEVKQVGVAEVAGVGVAVLVCQPLVFAGVRVARADVLTL